MNNVSIFNKIKNKIYVSEIKPSPKKNRSSINIVSLYILEYNLSVVERCIYKISELIKCKTKMYSCNLAIKTLNPKYLEFVETSVRWIITIIENRSEISELYEKISTIVQKNETLNKTIFEIMDLFDKYTIMIGDKNYLYLIKELVVTYKSNMEYIYRVIEDNKLVDYGYNCRVKDLINLKEDTFIGSSYDGTPLKKRCIKRGSVRDMITESFMDDIFDMENKQNTKEYQSHAIERKIQDMNKENGKSTRKIQSQCRKGKQRRTKKLLQNKNVSNDISDIELKHESSINFYDKSSLLEDFILLDKEQINKKQVNSFDLYTCVKEDMNIQSDSILEDEEAIIDFLDIKKIRFEDLPQNIVKVAEATFSEVFKWEDIILKIIPLGDNYTSITDFYKESYIQKILSQEEGICKLKEIFIVTGKYTEKYLEAWDLYGIEENERPDKFGDNQKYGVLYLEDSGISLEKCKLRSANEATMLFKKIISTIYTLEEKYEFEHRDLHWGNILVKDGQIRIIDFTLSRMKTPTNHIIYNDLNKKEWLFEGDAGVDEQFEIYREMRTSCKGDWKKYCPVNNLYWIRYLINKIYSKVNNKKSIRIRSQLLDVLKKSATTKEFIELSKGILN